MIETLLELALVVGLIIALLRCGVQHEETKEELRKAKFDLAMAQPAPVHRPRTPDPDAWDTPEWDAAMQQEIDQQRNS